MRAIPELRSQTTTDPSSAPDASQADDPPGAVRAREGQPVDRAGMDDERQAHFSQFGVEHQHASILSAGGNPSSIRREQDRQDRRVGGVEEFKLVRFGLQDFDPERSAHREFGAIR